MREKSFGKVNIQKRRKISKSSRFNGYYNDYDPTTYKLFSISRNFPRKFAHETANMSELEIVS